MKNKFSCPYCGHTQPFLKLLTLKKKSTWRCATCDHEVKPSNFTMLFNYFSLLLLIGVFIYTVLVLKTDFLTTMLIAGSTGIALFLCKMIYYYFSIELSLTTKKAHKQAH